MQTYGTKELRFTLEGIKEAFNWNFIISEVAEGILGADFLAKHYLLVDCNGRKVIKRQPNVH